MDEFLSDFLVECSEILGKVDQDLVELERNPGDMEVLKNIFRAVHTVKGTCGMFGLQRLEKIAHAAEDVLHGIQHGKLTPSPATIGPVLGAIDIIKTILEGIERDHREPAGDDSAAIQNLHALLDAPAGIPAEAKESGGMPDPGKSKASIADQSLRVNIDVLDGLMNLVGELVLTRNQLVQLVRGDDESKYLGPIQQLNRVTSGLQETVMKTRMQPIGNAWTKLPRIVRDLAQSTGKEIGLVMSGQETEIDRQILQAIQDPLVHCVRNSADHGLETPEARMKSGKPTAGTISLNAFHEGGHIIIEIKDDGAGIDLPAVRAKAIERGLLSTEAAGRVSDEEAVRLIFEPGFSTARQVTEVSGRGVGMDVVKSNVERIGGSVGLETRAGAGTTIHIRIPLTLAIISALIVKVGGPKGDVFAIPQVGVVELVRISENNHHLVERIHGSKVLRLRDRLLPLLDLASILGLDGDPDADDEGHRGDFSVVVAQVGELQFGLCVDEIFDTQEIVVKPVGRILRDINLFAGSTILGDGRVVIILDTSRISDKVLERSRGNTEASAESAVRAGERALGDRTTLLLFRSGDNAPLAVPLALVSRLEEFPASAIEEVAGRQVVQYRGALLPLLTVDGTKRQAAADGGTLPAILFSDGKRSMGLLVSEVADIVEETLVVESSNGKKGILGATIIAGQATELIDTYYFLQLAYPDWFQSRAESGKSGKKRILFVEDSSFFRDLIRPLLESKGHLVSVAADGLQALQVLERGERFDLILSDIEMPEMDGLALAVKLKQSPLWKDIPLLALTSLTDPAERQRGLAVGFQAYLTKFDPDVLFSAIAETFSRGSGPGDQRDATT